MWNMNVNILNLPVQMLCRMLIVVHVSVPVLLIKMCNVERTFIDFFLKIM